MRSSRCAAAVGALSMAVVFAVASTASAAGEWFPPSRIVVQTIDEDNVPHLRVALCAEPIRPTAFRLTARLVTPDEGEPASLCATHAITDIPGAREVLDSVELDPDSRADTILRTEDDYDADEVIDGTGDEPVHIGTITSVQVGDSVKNLNVLGVAVQDSIKDNEIPVLSSVRALTVGARRL